MTFVNPLAIPQAILPAVSNHPIRAVAGQDLRNDQVVRATVAEGGIERVILEVEGERFRAATRTPLYTGQRLDLKVEQDVSGIVLRLLPPPLAERLRRSLHLLADPLRMDPLFASLTTTGTNLPTGQKLALEAVLHLLGQQNQAHQGELLRILADLLGLTMEKHLAQGESELAGRTIKALLLGRSQETTGQPTAETRLLQQLEALQLTRSQMAENGLLFLPLPFTELEYGYLLIDQQEGSQTEAQSRQVHLSLHLRLSRLGNLELHLYGNLNGFRLKITCAEAVLIPYIENQLGSLGDSLGGLPLLTRHVAEGAEDPAGHLVRLVTGEHQALNTRI